MARVPRICALVRRPCVGHGPLPEIHEEPAFGSVYPDLIGSLRGLGGTRTCQAGYRAIVKLDVQYIVDVYFGATVVKLAIPILSGGVSERDTGTNSCVVDRDIDLAERSQNAFDRFAYLPNARQIGNEGLCVFASSAARTTTSCSRISTRPKRSTPLGQQTCLLPEPVPEQPR